MEQYRKGLKAGNSLGTYDFGLIRVIKFGLFRRNVSTVYVAEIKFENKNNPVKNYW